MILVIGSEEEYHSQYIYNLLKNDKEDVEYFDTRQFPISNKINWYAADGINNGNFVVNNKKIPFCDIKSIYWRWRYSFDVCRYLNFQASDYVSYIMNHEVTSTLDSLFYSLNCNWVNSIEAINFHKTKAYQLFVLAQNGFRVPKTLISNDSEEIINFAEENDFKLIYKPVQGGCHTKPLSKDELTKEKLESLKAGAVQFQEKLDGIDIRVYVIEDKIFAAEIHSETVDFREDINAKIIPVTLPSDVEKQCLKIMKLFELKFSGIDIKTKSNGEYVFIEANPAPMFIGFEKQSGYNISENLCNLLKKSTK